MSHTHKLGQIFLVRKLRGCVCACNRSEHRTTFKDILTLSCDYSTHMQITLVTQPSANNTTNIQLRETAALLEA